MILNKIKWNRMKWIIWCEIEQIDNELNKMEQNGIQWIMMK